MHFTMHQAIGLIKFHLHLPKTKKSHLVLRMRINGTNHVATHRRTQVSPSTQDGDEHVTLRHAVAGI